MTITNHFPERTEKAGIRLGEFQIERSLCKLRQSLSFDFIDISHF